ncbi:hypothetical protein RJ639_018771 [Escallonia herrerae]|uniref:Uncharacterized protein n=1 Tax=Escallonia herrerae TaxID=1293975 RepID=A0AA88V9S7_9ASTE|nr:hypothetical protein RJ639_018771 [Escallonia herrerae]
MRLLRHKAKKTGDQTCGHGSDEFAKESLYYSHISQAIVMEEKDTVRDNKNQWCNWVVLVGVVVALEAERVMTELGHWDKDSLIIAMILVMKNQLLNVNNPEFFSNSKIRTIMGHIGTAAALLNLWQSPCQCDGLYRSDDLLIVALWTGWFEDYDRCLRKITISANVKSVTAEVLDECDSSMGCDKDHAYQPPYANNVVGASSAVWKALGVSRDKWGGGLNVTSSDA